MNVRKNTFASLLVALLSALWAPAVSIARASDCCAPGAACCFAGSPCCAGHRQ